MTHTSPAVRIPFNRPTRTDLDERFIAEALASGKLAGDGVFTRRAQTKLEQLLGVHKALLTTSCTDALEMAALLSGVGPGDEVIIPTFTFVSSVNAFALRGARPIFADIRPDTLCLDERQLEQLVSPRTKVIEVVHYAGVPCDMDRIMAAATRAGAIVVEDNAHGFMGTYQGRMLGTIAPLGALSFHDTKNLTCGEGGALLVNDPELIERAEIIREKGTDRSKFLRGHSDKYGWVDLGSSFLPSEILAAMLAAQLENVEYIQSTRERLWHRYAVELANWAEQCGVTLPYRPAEPRFSYHMFNVLVPDIAFRDGLFAHLRARGIQAVSHYIPLHLSPMGRKLGGFEGQCPVAERVNELIVRLPFFTTMSDDEQAEVIAAVTAFAGRPARP
jgi:dTDP-4-amino-4,6-dideoxygalactose transaminase